MHQKPFVGRARHGPAVRAHGVPSWNWRMGSNGQRRDTKGRKKRGRKGEMEKGREGKGRKRLDMDSPQSVCCVARRYFSNPFVNVGSKYPPSKIPAE